MNGVGISTEYLYWVSILGISTGYLYWVSILGIYSPYLLSCAVQQRQVTRLASRRPSLRR